MGKLVGLVYLVIGVVVAVTYDYFDKLGSVRRILSALLAVILWPLVVLGVDLQIEKIDDGGKALVQLLTGR